MTLNCSYKEVKCMTDEECVSCVWPKQHDRMSKQLKRLWSFQKAMAHDIENLSLCFDREIVDVEYTKRFVHRLQTELWDLEKWFKDHK